MQKPRVAFVATGGAARGIAHLGVLKACEELGVRPSIFIGTGSGAIVAATYGQGVPLDVLMDAHRLPWRRKHRGARFDLERALGLPRLRDLASPGYLMSGLFSIDRFEGYLARNLPSNDFRAIDRRIIVTAVDIDSGERVLFGKGYDDATPVSRAVAAACCVPGLFRPYEVDGRFLVDGEVARTLSADVALDAGADVVVISNVYRPDVTGPRERSVARRGVASVVHQTVNILMTEKEKRGVDLYARVSPHTTFIDVAPNLGALGYLNWLSARSLVMRGYRAALRALAAAKEDGVFDVARSARVAGLN